MEKTKNYLLLYTAFAVYSIASVMSKIASGQTSRQQMILYIGLEIVFLGFYALIWQQALKKFPLSIAMANKGVTVIFTMLWSVIIFGESISLNNIIGSIIVIIGITVVSGDD